MRKFIISIFSSILFLAGTGTLYVANAQRLPQPKELLLQMREALDGMGAADFGFSFMAEDQAGNVLGKETGNFLAEGERFRMTTSSLTVYCDGKTKWLYDMANEEITVFPHDTASTDPAENPFAVLRKADPSGYDFKGSVRNVEYEGRPALEFRMASKDKNAAYTVVDFTVSAEDWLPVAIVYKNRNGDVYHLSVLSVSSVNGVTDALFVPPAELLDSPDVLVTDMR